jgi:tRNA-dihydrouridine synthase
MAEVSHRALRELIEDFGGCDQYFTEMISAAPLINGGPFESWYTDAGPCPERVVYQIAGANPDRLTAAARLLDRNVCAGIDVNMGCSAPGIARAGAGVAWMASIDKARALIGRLRKQTRRRLSVKLRIGFEDNFDYLAAFCTSLSAEGVDFITLHPRTAKEKFKRKARWDYVSRLRAVLSIPVAGNGDIAGSEELVRRASGECDAVMIGRLAVRSPWVFAEARAIETARPVPADIDLESLGFRFLDLLGRHQPPEFHTSRAHRFFSYFCDNLTWSTWLKTSLYRETGLSAMSEVWRAYFRDHPEERRLRRKVPVL